MINCTTRTRNEKLLIAQPVHGKKELTRLVVIASDLDYSQRLNKRATSGDCEVVMTVEMSRERWNTRPKQRHENTGKLVAARKPMSDCGERRVLVVLVFRRLSAIMAFLAFTYALVGFYRESEWSTVCGKIWTESSTSQVMDQVWNYTSIYLLDSLMDVIN